MEIRISKNPGQMSILSRITYILIGIMFTSLIFSLSIKHLHTYGIYITLLASIPASYFLFKKTQPKTKLRMMTWGLTIMTGTLILTYAMFLISIATMEV